MKRVLCFGITFVDIAGENASCAALCYLIFFLMTRYLYLSLMLQEFLLKNKIPLVYNISLQRLILSFFTNTSM